MVNVDAAQLYAWTNAFLWPFFRILALVGTAPLLSDSSIPIRVKIGLSALLTLSLLPFIGPFPQLPTASYAALWLACEQVLIGIAMGLVMRVIFAAVQTAGELVGLQMGLSFAAFFDPALGANTAVLSRLFYAIAVLLFLALDGHLHMLDGLVRSFETLPVHVQGLETAGWQVLFIWSSQILESGMMLALPLIITLLSISLSLGILNRTAQQLSVFAVGFPISLLGGLVLLVVVLPHITQFMSGLFGEANKAMARIVRAMAGL